VLNNAMTVADLWPDLSRTLLRGTRYTVCCLFNGVSCVDAQLLPNNVGS